MALFLRAAVFLIAFNLLAGNIPGIMPKLTRLSGLVVFIVWVRMYFPLGVEKKIIDLAALFLIPASFGLMLFEPTVLPAIGICVFALTVLSKNGAEPAEKELQVCLLTTLLYTMFFMLYRYSPHFWYMLQHISLGFSAAVSSVAGHKMTLGPTALGLPITVSALCYGIGLIRFNRKPLFVLAALLVPVCILAVYLWLQRPLEGLIHLIDEKRKPTSLDFQGILLVLSIVAIFPLSRKVRFDETAPSNFFKLRWKYAIPSVLLVFCAFLSLSFYSKGDFRKGQVLFHDLGANWNVPYYGKVYGQHSAGMFGMLPYYLRMRGVPARVTKNGLTWRKLKKASAVVVFNPSKYLTGAEKNRLYKFVERGGSLLVAGDHTDVSHVMGPINDILAPFPIRLNFDTALPISSGWVHGLEKRPHPVLAGMKTDQEAGIWVGASLDIWPPGRPVIAGTRGWADIGDYSNTKRAYLGDYKRSPDEQLGDVVLVAEAAYGKGRVLVFGDTSSFQNGILMHTNFFMDRIFNWLMSPGEIWHPGLQCILWIVFLSAAGFMIRKTPCSAVLAACILAAHIGPWIWQIRNMENQEELLPKAMPSHYSPAYIDASHLGRFSDFASAENSLWGFSINLMRNGYMPLMMREISQDALLRAKLFIAVAPTVEFSKREMEILRKFMEKGGRIIWAVGWEEADASKSFLDEFGFFIDAVPIGPADIELEKGKVKFLEAWPVMGGSESKEVIIEKWDLPIIVYQPVGEGGLMVIGDSRFLHSRNIESYKKHDLNNIRYIRYLLERLKDRPEADQKRKEN